MASESRLNFSNKRIPELDGVRGMAILIILVFHYVVVEGNSILPR
jgi:peptidoglycan/LPS O-acetylase OafA/YrhL